MSIHYSCTQTERAVYKNFRSRTRFYSGIRGQGCRGRLGVAFGVRGKRLPQLRVQSSSESLSECLFPGTNTPAPQNQAHGGSAKYRHWGSCSCRGARCSVTASRIPHPAPPCPPPRPPGLSVTSADRCLQDPPGREHMLPSASELPRPEQCPSARCPGGSVRQSAGPSQAPNVNT